MHHKAANDTGIFKDRTHAGQELAKALASFSKDKIIILALPRGGVPLGYELAKILSAPLDVIVARKIGMPQNKEFGIGAIAEGGIQILDKHTIDSIGLSQEALDELIKDEEVELNRRVTLYRKHKKLPNLHDKTVILVDDGLATGVTAKAAIETIKKHHPKRLIFAAPVCAYDTAQELSSMVDDVICLISPLDLRSVGMWYQHFDQTSDEEVVHLLSDAKQFSLAKAKLSHGQESE